MASGMNRAGAAVLLWLGLGLAGCERSYDGTTPEDTAAADAPALNEVARDEAVAMIIADLNAPLVELQDILARAAADGRINPDELQMAGANGTTPVDWWLWNKGYLRLTDDPYYGPYLTLSDKGARFVGGAAPVWLNARAEGAPKMECQSAGALTRAVCTASVAYVVSLAPGGDLARVVIPSSSANLEAAFAPGAGWTVERLSVDGDAPRDVARTAIFGTPEMAVEPRERFFEAVRVQLENGRAKPAEPERATMPEDVGVAASPAIAPVLDKPSPKRAPVIVNARLLRRPSPEEMMAVYPPRALSQGLDGRATMTCTATVEGLLSDCTATSETPPGHRFGQAAVALASRYRTSPRTVDGEAVDSSVNLTLSWPPN
ncbi:Gram-negative bacterial tonB protein [compost metagenome]